MLVRQCVLYLHLDTTACADTTHLVLDWAKAGQSRYVCVANVHTAMESYDSAAFRNVTDQADLVVPDGMPLVWASRLLWSRGQQRVYGPDLTLDICARAAQEGTPVALYGGTNETLEALTRRLLDRFPGLQFVCRISPLFRPLTEEEDAAYTRQLVESGARIIFVGIGCPKQERWMAAHKGRIPAVMIGVGAAFDFLSGRVRQAPAWMQRAGLEWLFRLAMEPKRLWWRYFKHNPRFVLLFALQLAGIKLFREAKP